MFYIMYMGVSLKVLLMTVHLIYMRKNDCSTCQVRGGHFFVVLSLLEPIE